MLEWKNKPRGRPLTSSEERELLRSFIRDGVRVLQAFDQRKSGEIVEFPAENLGFRNHAARSRWGRE